MDKVNSDLQRLLRAAAAARPEEPAEVPFGFETRVLANWRAQRFPNGGWRAFTLLFRRVVLSAALVAVCASAGAYWQFSQNEELTEPALNAYVIADNAIDVGALQ